MSVKVNLLPREIAGARVARRTSNLTVVGVLVFALMLGGLYFLKLNEIQQAEGERDAVQADVSRLQAEVASLEQFRQLADQLEARNAILASAMADEVSFARVMNDLSLSFPPGSSLRSMQVATRPAEISGGEVSFGEALAGVTYEGYSVERFAPGVEAVLVEFDKVSSFFGTYIGSARLEEIGTTEVTSFQGTVQLDERARTGRYAEGLPNGEMP